GIYFAKKSITQKDNCYLVEGYTDVISLYQKGIQNVVSSSGTSLTEDQIRLIKRYTQNITILYDGDPAGIKASFRGIDMILAEDMNVKVLLFPEGDDPDSFAQKHSTEELEEFLTSNATDFLQFKIKIQKEEINNDPIKKVEVLNDIANSISLIPDAIKRSVYTKECASLLDISEQALISEINKKIRKKLSGKLNKQEKEDLNKLEPHTSLSANKTTEKVISRRNFWEEEIMRLLCNYANEPVTVEIEIEPENEDDSTSEVQKQTVKASAAEWILKELHDDNINLNSPVFNEIIDFFKEKIINGDSFSTQALIHHPNEEISKTVINLLAEKHELSENWKKHNIIVLPEKEVLNQSILQTLKFFKLEFVAEEIRQMQARLKETNEPQEVINILNQIKNYTEIKKRLAKELGVTVM
ncbi:MAG TPA: DNA primase, partial [Flavobacteriales bacterium]|nr:DNA primase [Flavobacteriales bacterium]